MCQTHQPTRTPRATQGAACKQCLLCLRQERVAAHVAERIAAANARRATHDTLKTQNPTNPIS